MNRQWVVDLVRRLPQASVSRAWGWLARRRRPRVGISVLKRLFVAAAGIDMQEAELGVSGYATLEELFVRRLRQGARRVDPDPASFVCPVDARVGARGKVDDGTLLQVKGRTYRLETLLDDAEEAKRFEGGDYATFYLSPRDYHRIHSPVAGQVAKATVIEGSLMPVFEESIETVDELFARNERLVTYVDSPDAGRVAVVKVGATLVGRITVAYDSTIRTNDAQLSRRRCDYDPPRLLSKGAEVGAFEMGSTVVVIVEPGRVEIESFNAGDRVRMGQRIGLVVGRSRARKRGKKATKTRSRKRKT